MEEQEQRRERSGEARAGGGLEEMRLDRAGEDSARGWRPEGAVEQVVEVEGRARGRTAPG